MSFVTIRNIVVTARFLCKAAGKGIMDALAEGGPL